MFVDEILIIGNNVSMLESVKVILSSCLLIEDLGETVHFWHPTL